MLRWICIFPQFCRQAMTLATLLLPTATITLTLCLITACKQESPPTTAPATTPAATGPRIISTVPAATMQLLQIGVVDQLVGVTKYDLPILPPGKENLPVVGDYDTLNYELLIKLHPTALVVQMTPSHITARLKEIIADNHIELVNVKLDTIADLYATAEALGRVSNHTKEAAAAITSVRNTLANIQRQWADAPHPRIAYLLSASPIMAVGADTFMDETLKISGSINVCAAIGSDYPIINREALIKLAPDVLLIAAAGEPPSAGLQDPRLAPWIDLPIPAARHNRIYLITDPNGQLSTLDIAKQVRALARIIHQADPAVSAPASKVAP